MVYPNNGILLGNKKKWLTGTHGYYINGCNMDIDYIYIDIDNGENIDNGGETIFEVIMTENFSRIDERLRSSD